MKILFPVFIICILILETVHPSNPFCKESEYACKQEGITQCRPKTNRCYDGSECVKLLPIEKPPCKQECVRENELWCEERGQCIDNKEVCDCGPGKVYCTATGTYSCENRNGIVSSSIFTICRDGRCASDCEGKDTNTSCKEGQFKCGEHCKDINEVTDFRICKGKCIDANYNCFQTPKPTITTPSPSITTSSPSSNSTGPTSGEIVGILIIILILLLLSFFIYKKWEHLTELARLMKLERSMTIGYREKQQGMVLNDDKQNRTNDVNKQQETANTKVQIEVGDLDTQKYELLCVNIKRKKNNMVKHLFKLRKTLENPSNIELEPLESDTSGSLEDQILKFIEDGFVYTGAEAAVNASDVTEKSNTMPVSLKSKLKMLNNTYPWLLVEEEHSERGCYCLVCVQAGVDNEFTKYPGAAPTDQIIEDHLQDSFKGRDTSLSIETKTDENKEVSKDSHNYAKQIISEVESFSKDAMKSRSTFSLILYEQKNVLSVILKGLKIIDKTELRDIYIPLDMIEIEENSQALSTLNVIQKTLKCWDINLEQISSISTVNIGGKLPSKSEDVCKLLSQLAKCECIKIHNVSHEPTLDMQQGNVDNPFQEILQRVLGAFTFVLSQSPHGYEILRNKQEEYKEPIVTQEMFRQINKRSAKDIIHFVRSCPKSIHATLMKIGDKMEDSNETDENKQRVGGLLKIMDKFTTKATMLLYETITDVFHEVFSHHEEPYFDWNRKAVEGQVEYLKSVLKKINKEDMDTSNNDDDFIPIYMEESNCLKTRDIFQKNTDIKREYFLQTPLVNSQNDTARECLKKLLKEAQDEKNTTQTEINLFRNYQNQVIQTAVQDLESSFPNESMRILHGISKVFSTKKITTIANKNHYKEPMNIVGNKFSIMKTNKENLKEIDDIKKHFPKEDVRKISGLLITNYSDTLPNFAYMAEIYLNVNLNTPVLQQILLEIDGVIKITRPKLNLQEKNKKVLVSSISIARHQPRHQLRQQQESNVNNIVEGMASLQLNQETMQCDVKEAVGSYKLNMETMQSSMGNEAVVMGSSNLNFKIPQLNPEKDRERMYRERRKSDSSDRRRNGGSPSSSRGHSGSRSRSRSR